MRSYIKTPEAVRPISPWNFVGNLFSAYGFPRDLPGGSMIGIGELGGGWVPSDVSTFFQLNGLVEPGIIDVSVNGAGNNADVTDPASGEVALDIQLAAAAYTYCTGEIASLRIYWAPNAAGSIAAATKMAADDGCDVMSWSWGEDEALTGKEACVEMDAVVAEAAANGMVVTAAAGDNDSSDGGNTPANVDSPASCPHVIACGGTRKEHAIGVETVWNNNPGKTDGEGTGGGLSTVFAIPSWQAKYFHGRTMRVVPDVAANADPYTGYRIVLGGQEMIIGGTSAVAPLMAGLIAACGPKPGFILPTLWANTGAFFTNIPGNNGMYSQPPVPGPCSGLGRPKGGALAKLLVK